MKTTKKKFKNVPDGPTHALTGQSVKSHSATEKANYRTHLVFDYKTYILMVLCFR